MEILKRSEVKLKLEEKLKSISEVSDEICSLMVENMLSELETLNLLEKSQLGSVCSRCKKTSWQSESC
jgi:hypothetical protein